MRRSIPVVLAFGLVIGALGGCSGGGGGDDDEGVISFISASFRQNEDGTPGALAITIERVGGTAAVSATLTFSGGTATGGGVDYDSTPIVVSWPAGDTSNMVVTVPVIDDNIDEQPFETVNLALGSPTGGATIGLGDAVLNINDEDEAGVVEFQSAAFAYFETGGAFSAITVIRTGGMDGDVTVQVTSTDGTANSDPLSLVEPVDYSPISFIVMFADQSTTPVIVPVSIVEDLLPELDEEFTVALGSPTNGVQIGAVSSATVTIFDNDLFLQIDNPALSLSGFFGSSVAKIGPRLAIGAPGNLTGAGQVFAVNVDLGTLHDSYDGGVGSQGFGRALASSGNTLGIGGTGMAFSFGGDASLTNYSERYSVLNPDAGFGAPVAINAATMVVGAPNAQIGGSLMPSGRVYSYDVITGSPVLPVLEGVADNRFGSSLAAVMGNLLVGAPGGVGQVQGFSGSPLTLGLVITNPFPQMPSNAFGQAVAINPLNGTILVGAPDGDTFAPDDGRVHVFSAAPPLTILAPGAALAMGRFGAQILVLSDGRFCVQQQGGNGGVGRIFVFDPAGALLGMLDSPAPASPGDFGASMCEFDGVLAVGAPKHPAFVQSGIVFIMKLP
jgi:Calx-beta domain